MSDGTQQNATVGYTDAPARKPLHPSALATDATLAGDSPRDVSMHATLAATSEQSEAMVARLRPGTNVGRNTTALPEVTTDASGTVQLVALNRLRYESQRMLGAGGMGEVHLANDNDIGRTVAIKQLLGDVTGPASVARFVEEVRTIGKLEHPNIVPIHDVGLNENGQYFFVMKYVDGETLEDVIDKLRTGDAAYHAKYTTEYRIEIFLGVLRALQYAHANGVIHRDIKPANVMIGRFGEVMLMDWGISRKIDAPDLNASDPSASNATDDAKLTKRERAFKTRHGALLGTPAYMSPEQAKGLVDSLDARTDVYSACVMFHEFLSLRHYLEHKEDVHDVITGSITEIPDFSKVHPAQGRIRAELMFFLGVGFQKDPRARFASAGEMIDRLHEIVDGRVRVQCPVTFTKRMVRNVGRVVDRAPWAVMFAALLVVMFTMFGVFTAVRSLVG